MKVLVFSDTHLSSKFEEKKYHFLTSIIRESDRVIINGDFWEGYTTSFQQFIDSPWRNLFSLLKLKKTVYLHGNHDKSDYVDKNCYLFSDIQTTRYTLTINNITYIFEHGNRLMSFGDENEACSSKRVKLTDTVEKTLIRMLGDRYQKFLKKYNKIIKKKLQLELDHGEYYVCGHTHSAEIDEENKFINTGLIKHGLGQYLLIDQSGHSAQSARYI